MPNAAQDHDLETAIHEASESAADDNKAHESDETSLHSSGQELDHSDAHDHDLVVPSELASGYMDGDIVGAQIVANSSTPSRPSEGPFQNEESRHLETAASNPPYDTIEATVQLVKDNEFQETANVMDNSTLDQSFNDVSSTQEYNPFNEVPNSQPEDGSYEQQAEVYLDQLLEK